MQENESLIRVNNLGLSLGGRVILEHVTLDIHANEILTVIGPNGAGKSCLIKCLLGLIPPTTGSIVKAKRLNVGYTPQKIHFEQSMPITVAQFMRLGHKTPINVQESLAEVGADKLINTWMYGLSGGELQRVLLARALSHRPDLLVLDEPAAGVDIIGQAEVYRLLATIRERYGCGICVVSHDLSLVMAETDKVVCLNKHICCEGNPELVAKHPAFTALFGENVSGLALYKHSHDHKHEIEGSISPTENKDD